MDISIDNMKSCIQEWYAQALDFDELFEIDNAVKIEAQKQSVFLANEIAKNKYKYNFAERKSENE